jgi:hypothetical protein
MPRSFYDCELSTLTFTDQDDVVPAFGVEQILNTGIANTLAGNDTLNGRNKDKSITFNEYSFRNYGTLNTCEGNDILTGTSMTLTATLRGLLVFTTK